MKERPILMSAPMVCAILDGTKTQTRRAVKPGGKEQSGGIRWWEQTIVDGRWLGFDGLGKLGDCACPYGVVGDRLWVKETFCPRSNGKTAIDRMQIPFYRATDDHEERAKPITWNWRPSIFMPRWASRITLEVTGVRVQRVQDITEEDARAEGVEPSTVTRGPEVPPRVLPVPARENYAGLWNRINGEGAWALNPWVWVISFKRCEITSHPTGDTIGYPDDPPARDS